jgi:5S rRNA maturation endonuclease (ribonuclease M5)
MSKRGRDDIIQYLEDSLDVLRKSGDELTLRHCLFCNRVGKMYVNVGKLKFHCYHADCHASGGIVALVMAIEDCDRAQAMRVVMEKVRGQGFARPASELMEKLRALVEGRSIEVDEELEVVSSPLPDEYRPCWTGKAWRIPDYLKPRVTKDEILQWDIGYCKAGRTKEEYEAGSNRYAGRIIIPVHTDGLSAFVARDFTGKAKRKYLNPTGALAGRLLVGYDMLEAGKPVVVVEGAFDTIALWRHGHQAVGVIGSGLRPEQIRLLRLKKPSELILMPDPDAVAAGAREATKLAGYFPCVRLARIVGGDPDEIGKAMVDHYIATAEVAGGATFPVAESLRQLRNPWGVA